MHRLLQTNIKGLLATRVEFPFGGTSTKCSAFFVPRNDGKNVWIYSSSHVGDYLSELKDELGGVEYQLLNHRDEASKFSNVLNAPVFCHALEKSAIENKGAVVGETFEGKTFSFGDDLIAYHTPGHTMGVTSYFWKVDKETSVLFPGDSLYINSNGILEHGPLVFYPYENNLHDMIQSFELMLQLSPTYLVPGLSMGDGFVTEFDPERIRELIAKLEQQQQATK